MQLTQHQDGEFSIRKLEPDRIMIGAIWVQTSFILTTKSLTTALQINQYADLRPEHVAELLSLPLAQSPQGAIDKATAPDVVLLATGSKQRMPEPALRAAFLTRRIGVEAMDLRAACYTFNVLAQEGRHVMLIGFFN